MPSFSTDSQLENPDLELLVQLLDKFEVLPEKAIEEQKYLADYNGIKILF